MKTIRENTFETNSSSTHSVTIRSKTKKSKSRKPLVKNGELIPENLSDYTQSFGDSTGTVCDTKDMKAAIVVHWLKEAVNDAVSQETFDKAINILKEKGGYSDIKIPNYSSFYSYNEYDDAGDSDYIDDLGNGNLKSFEKFVDKVILNDDIEIDESDEAH